MCLLAHINIPEEHRLRAILPSINEGAGGPVTCALPGRTLHLLGDS